MPLRFCSAGGMRSGSGWPPSAARRRMATIAARARALPSAFSASGRSRASSAASGRVIGLRRAVARLLPAQAEPVRRHDQHRGAERADGLELVAHGRHVRLRVLERLRLSARVLLAREEDDLDRVAARRGRVEHATQPELDVEVGRRRVRREQRVGLEVVGRRVAVRQSAPGGERGERDREQGGERAARPKEGRRVSAPLPCGRGADRPTASCSAAPRRCLRVAQRAAGVGVRAGRRPGSAVALDQVEALGRRPGSRTCT